MPKWYTSLLEKKRKINTELLGSAQPMANPTGAHSTNMRGTDEHKGIGQRQMPEQQTSNAKSSCVTWKLSMM